jgi:hypothetical protein
MSQPHNRAAEPLFIIAHRSPDAHARLTRWIASNRNIQARAEDHRMYIYDHNTLSLFVLTWTHGWDQVVIWDTWLKRHINV